MLFTTHTAAGAVIGALCRTATSASLVGAVSHYVCDALPHWGAPRTRTTYLAVAVADGLAGAATLALVAGAAPPGVRARMLAGAVAAGMPDWNKPAALVLGHDPTPEPLRSLHVRIQRHETPDRLASDAVRSALAIAVAAGVALGARAAVRYASARRDRNGDDVRLG